MDDSSLKLTILQGPNKGETRELKPGTQRFRIGRVVTGNNLTIKDSGISSKHLSITFESCKWVLRDLDSSNGTILNSTQIAPNTGFDLRHGDVFKIGEWTSVLVELGGEGNVGAGNVGRKTGGRGKGSRNVEGRGVGAGGTRRGKGVVEEDGDVGGMVVLSARRTRSKKNEGNVVVESSELGCEDVGVGGRVTRARMRRMGRGGMGVEEGLEEKDGEEVEVRARGRSTRGRPRRKGKEIEGNSDKLEAGEKGSVVVKEEVEVGDELGLRDGGVDCIGEDNENENRVDVLGNEEIDAVLDGSGQNVKAGCDKVLGENKVEGMNPVEEGCSKIDDGSSARVELNSGKERADCGIGATENSRSEHKSFNMEKMTLGEWLDYLEEFLPIQIIDATDDMMKDMKEKAARICEYIEQQKNENEVPVS